MKKIAIIAVLFLIGALGAKSVEAQKIGYVDMQEIIFNMPEAKDADSSLRVYQQDLYQEMQNMQQEFQDNAAKFIADSLNMSEAVKEVKRDELQSQQQRIARFQQEAQDRIAGRQQSLFKPVVGKAKEAVQAVAKQKGYTWVLNAGGDDEELLGVLVVKPQGDDLTADVKTNLGIK